MKAEELRKMSDAELVEKKKELREDVFRMKFKLAAGDFEDTSAIGKAKKNIARIECLLSERNAASEQA